jgi:hypothetical protein
MARSRRTDIGSSTPEEQPATTVPRRGRRRIPTNETKMERTIRLTNQRARQCS